MLRATETLKMLGDLAAWHDEEAKRVRPEQHEWRHRAMARELRRAATRVSELMKTDDA